MKNVFQYCEEMKSKHKIFELVSFIPSQLLKYLDYYKQSQIGGALQNFRQFSVQLETWKLNVSFNHLIGQFYNISYYMTNSYRPGLKKFDWFKAGL